MQANKMKEIKNRSVGLELEALLGILQIVVQAKLCLMKLIWNRYVGYVVVGSKIRDFYSSYVNGLEQTNNKVECLIFKAVFKKLITRLAAVSKELRATENMVSKQCTHF